MRRRVTLAGEPVHPLLVLMPLCLFGAAVALDVILRLSPATVWSVVAFWDLGVGLALGVAAAADGRVDLLALASGRGGSRAGVTQGSGTAAAVALFALCFGVGAWAEAHAPGSAAVLAAIAGLGASAGAAWLGASLGES